MEAGPRGSLRSPLLRQRLFHRSLRCHIQPYDPGHRPPGRIKAARESQPEQPETSEESQKSDPHPAINFYWINPETGEKTLAAQTPGARDTQEPQRTDPPS